MATPSKKKSTKEKSRGRELSGTFEAFVLPVRNTVLFPDTVLMIVMTNETRESSVQIVERAKKEQFPLAIFSQKNDNLQPTPEDINTVGTLGRVVRVLPQAEGNTAVLFKGTERIKLKNYLSQKPPIRARVSLWKDPPLTKSAVQWMPVLHKKVEQLVGVMPGDTRNFHHFLRSVRTLSSLVHFIASNFFFSLAEKQELLSLPSLEKRASALLRLMEREIQQLGVKEEIASKVYSDIEQQQRNYFLKQQMKVLQHELGMDGGAQELELLAQKAEKKRWPKEAAEHFEREMNRIRHAISGTPEYSVSFNYLEFMVDLPWGVTHQGTHSFGAG